MTPGRSPGCRETRRAVVTGLRDCEVAYLAIGTIEVNQPKVSAVEGYTVTVSITGEVLDVSRRLPKKVAAIGPVIKTGLALHIYL